MPNPNPGYEKLTDDQLRKLQDANRLISDVQIERLKQYEHVEDEEWRFLYRLRCDLSTWMYYRNGGNRD